MLMRPGPYSPFLPHQLLRNSKLDKQLIIIITPPQQTKNKTPSRKTEERLVSAQTLIRTEMSNKEPHIQKADQSVEYSFTTELISCGRELSN